MTRRRRHAQDRGAAMVEFVFVAPLLVMLVFAIVFFGLALNIKQDLTRAASEGARVAAVALPDQDRQLVAENATDTAVAGFLGGGCDNLGPVVDTTDPDVDCQITFPVACDDDDGDGVLDHECVRVTIVYDGSLTGNWIPLAGMATPDKLIASSTARVNEVP